MEKIRRHEWVTPDMTKPGSIYQMDYCKHCNLIFESDLGWTSADGVKCVEREVIRVEDMTDRQQSWIRFKGLRFDPESKVFVKPYCTDIQYTMDEVVQIVRELETYNQ